MVAPDEQKPTSQDFTDPDDDLDDLDDVLSQFTPAQANHPRERLTSPGPPPPSTTTASYSRPRHNTRVDAPPVSVPGSGARSGMDPTSEADEDELSAAFSRELARGMESLMREINGGALPGESQGGKDNVGGTVDDKEAERVFKAAWEAMLVEGMDGTDPGGSGGLDGLESFSGNGIKAMESDDVAKAEDQSKTDAGETNDFQNRIRQAVDKLRESESNLQTKHASSPDSSSSGANPDSLEALLASFGDLGLGDGQGGEDETELAGLLENMMGQLMSKEVLYEPLKEMADKFPPYLANPPAPIPLADKQRYESQLTCVRKILAVFDLPDYTDDDPAVEKKIVDLMTEMQSYGSPPAEIMGPIPPGMGLGPDGTPRIGEGCMIA